MSTGTEAIVDALQAAGVDHVFGLPGTTIMGLIDVLGRREGIRYLSVRHEQTAAHMADGFWRASGRPAVALASRGPGAANLAIGVHNAFAESVPLIALVGQVPDELAHRDAFEEMDLVGFFKPITKWAVEIHAADRIGELVTRAVGAAQAGRPRPVLVSIPLDVQGREVSGERPRAPAEPRHPAPDAGAIADAVELLERSARPVLVLGGGALRTRHSEEIVALAEALRAPVVTTWMRKNAFPNRHECFAGTLGFGSHESAERAVREADAIVALGCRFSEFTTRRYSLIPAATPVLQVDVDAEEIGAVQPVAIGLVGDASAVAGTLASAVDGGERDDGWRASLRSAYRDESVLPGATGGAGAVASSAVIAGLAEVLRESPAVVVQDAHSFGPWVSRYLEFDEPGRYYAAAGGSMGWGLPAALGVQAARPAERVIALCGDGSFWMVAQDLETAVREDLPVVVVVLNNFSYGNTRDRQRHSHGGRYFGTFYDNPDFAAFARLLGAHGERVEHGSELAGAVGRALASGLPAVVDVIQDRHEGLPGDLRPLPAR
jgi:acetolactate synthase-1/2/3 large subunit